MPQFDSYSFSGQVLWSLLGYLFFFLFILKCYLSHFSEMLKFRQKLINVYSSTNSIVKNENNSLDFFFSNKIF